MTDPHDFDDVIDHNLGPCRRMVGELIAAIQPLLKSLCVFAQVMQQSDQVSPICGPKCLCTGLRQLRH